VRTFEGCNGGRDDGRRTFLCDAKADAMTNGYEKKAMALLEEARAHDNAAPAVAVAELRAGDATTRSGMQHPADRSRQLLRRERETALLGCGARDENTRRAAYTAVASHTPHKQLQRELDLLKVQKESRSEASLSVEGAKGVTIRGLRTGSAASRFTATQDGAREQSASDAEPPLLDLVFYVWMSQAQDRRRRILQSKKLFLVVELVSEQQD